jgi:apolipoprotein N-acyltransferase
MPSRWLPRALRARPASGPLTARRWSAALATGGGLAGAAAFPRLGIWPLAAISVACLSIAVHGHRTRTAAWLGYLYGAAFFLPLLHWTGVFVGAVPWLLLALAEATFCAGLGAVLSLVQRLPAAPVWIAAAWVLQEAARDRVPFGGFPWGRLAFSQADSPLRWFAALGGMPLLSFAVAVSGGALAWPVLPLTRRSGRGHPAFGAGMLRRCLAGTAGALAVFLVALGCGAVLAPPADDRGRTATIALIQGSVPDLGLDFETRARQVLDNHVAQTLRLAAQIHAGTVPRPSLVLWPENASDVDPFTDATAYREIDSTVRTLGVPVLVGAILDGPGNHRRNAGILWSPVSGPGAQYIKRHPVPFGEYIPLRSLAGLVSSDVNLVPQDMVRGHGDGLVTGGPFPIGDVICFEVAYDGLVRSSVAAGAQLVVVQTNNATFGHTSETYQQLAMTRLRAVETGRAAVQVATTGISAVIGPDGGVRMRSGALFTPDVLVATVPLRTGTTLATRLGSLPELLLAALAVLGLVFAVAPSRRRAAVPAAEPQEVVAHEQPS